MKGEEWVVGACETTMGEVGDPSESCELRVASQLGCIVSRASRVSIPWNPNR